MQIGHYTDRYINQRYNKALYIVQHLPTSSKVQPTKEQKLELYAYYKQASVGDVNTTRPGIFDLMGRSKWDAWKAKEGISQLDAKHRYVEILLNIATEAYKNPAGRVQAHQIIQSFAVMQPYGESGDSSDDTEESMSSREEEEKEYLRQIQTSSRQGKRRIQSSRASMRSQMSMMTPKSQQPSESNRPISVSSGRSGTMDGRRSELIRRRDLYEDNFDHTINPWILQPAHSIKHDDLSDNSYSTQNMSQNMSISSIVTERPRTDRLNALGPETRKALESLQAEIELLNERINGLRKEMEERDHSQRKSVKKYQEISNDWDGWKWVFTAAMKHALMNLMTATVLFLFLYKNDSPVAHVILDYWKKTKLQHWITRLLLSKKTI